MYPGLRRFLVAVGLILVFVPHGDDHILRTRAVIALVAGALVLLATLAAGVDRMITTHRCTHR